MPWPGRDTVRRELCRMLGVAPSGFYYWRGKPPSIRELRHEQLERLDRRHPPRSMGTYGYRRITAELRFAHERTSPITRPWPRSCAALGCKVCPSARPGAEVPAVTAPLHPTSCCAGSRRRSESPLADRHHRASHERGQALLLRRSWTLTRAVWSAGRSTTSGQPRWSRARWAWRSGRRKPRAGRILHSDQGSQFTSWAFSARIRSAGLALSMGRVGDAFDNAMMEAFWAWMQTELLNRQKWRTRLELANAIFEYLEIFHNRKRRHSRPREDRTHEYESLYGRQPRRLTPSQPRSITQGPDQVDHLALVAGISLTASCCAVVRGPLGRAGHPL